MAQFAPPPEPSSRLARYRILSPTAAVAVSPICLGTMTFGEAMKDRFGECTKETAFEILDYFYEQGGNFIDTAGSYQLGESEMWLGEWMSSRGRRDEMVIATKYTSLYKGLRGEAMRINYGGNSAKTLHLAVEDSLKNLQTSYIDLLYVHFWDMTASIPEVMQSLNHLITLREVLYIGISDTPAWIVAKCNAYARQHGLRQFSVYQGKWSAAERDFERDIIPMALDEGMALAPWGALGGGYFKPKEQWGKDGGRDFPQVRAKEAEGVYAVLESVAKRKGTNATSVALAYVMHKSPYVFPICGGRKVEHLKGNIEALGLVLEKEDIEDIERGYEFDVGFPNNMLSGDARKAVRGPQDVVVSARRGHVDYVEGSRALRPHH